MDAGQAVAAACLSSLGPPDSWRPPPGYEGLAKATIDAIWSMGVRYGSVGKVLDFLDEMIAERTKVNPEFLRLLDAADGRRQASANPPPDSDPVGNPQDPK